MAYCKKKKILVNPNVTTKNEEVLERKERRISKGIFFVVAVIFVYLLAYFVVLGGGFSGVHGDKQN